jgi:hypothetical protein
VDVGKNTTLCDGDVSEKLVQLLVIANGKLQMTRDDTGLLVVASSVAGQLEDFCCQILENSSEVNGSTGTDTLSVVALSQKTMDTTDGECEAGLGRAAEKVSSSRKSLVEWMGLKWNTQGPRTNQKYWFQIEKGNWIRVSVAYPTPQKPKTRTGRKLTIER